MAERSCSPRPSLQASADGGALKSAAGGAIRMDGNETCNEGFGSDGDGASAEGGMVELSLSDSDVSSGEGE